MTTTTSGKIVIAGGTGFLGSQLARRLVDQGTNVALLSRHAPTESGPCKHAKWDGRSLGDWVNHLENATALVNLCGRSVDCIKTADHCDEILRSRVESTKVLGQALRKLKSPPGVWVQMSTAHIYGDPPTALCDEGSTFGLGLAPTVAAAWEESYREAVLPDMRQVILRTSFVIGRNGGALKRLGKLARWGLGGTVGHGRQGMSWIHEIDMSRLMIRAVFDPDMAGTYVATAPHPVSNQVFMRELRQAMRVPLGLPAAQWMVRIGAPLLMRTDPELALLGRYCVSRRLEEEGFAFEYPRLGPALKNIYQEN